MKPTSLSLIIPCYNEEATLRNCVERCLCLESESLSLELLIIDDRSTDDSLNVARQLEKEYKQVKVFRHEENMGKGAALRTGFLHAQCDYVGIQDADSEYDPQEYLTLLRPMLEGKADVVYGSRYLKQESRRVLYFWHTWMNRTLTFLSNMFTNLDITDMETCYKLFRKEVIQELAPQLKENRFGFEPEITILVAQAKLRVYECAISYNPRTYEEGKKIGYKDGFRALYCILHYGAPSAPLPMQLLLYFFIGACCALFNLLSFSILLKTDLGLTGSILISFALAAALNYLLCIAVLFQHKARWSGKGEISAYLFSVACMGLIDYGMTNFLILLTVSPLWSKIWATLFGFVGNFLLRKYFVFGKLGKKASRG